MRRRNRRLKKGSRPNKSLRRLMLRNMRRNRQEVKHTYVYAQGDIQTVGSSTVLTTAQYIAVSVNGWPAQGTSDTQRVGDSINFIKWWCKITIENDASPTSNLIRIIFFHAPSYLTGSIDFFKFTSNQQAICGQPDQERYNVCYDKTFEVNTLVSAQRRVIKPINFNYRPRKMVKFPIQFQPGSMTPKNPWHQLYCAIIGYEPGVTTSGTAIGYYNLALNTYYTD